MRALAKATADVLNNGRHARPPPPLCKDEEAKDEGRYR